MWFNEFGQGTDDIPNYEVPRDEQDSSYVKSFLPSEVQEYKTFFQNFGFVVIRDVLTQDECNQSIDEIWNYIEKGEFKSQPTKSFKYDIEPSFPKRSDPSTWNTNWPSMAEEGIVGVHPIFKRQLILNRQNPLIYSVFSTLMNKKELIVNHDRVGLFRPTILKTIGPDGKEEVIARPGWKTIKNLHFDVNPWRYFSTDNEVSEAEERINHRLAELRYNNLSDFIFENNEIGRASFAQVHLQAVLNFYPNKESDGGFQLVPGFSKHAQEWVNKTRDKIGKHWPVQHTFIVLPDVCALHARSIRISVPAGSLIVWDQTTAHGSAPNHSTNPRYCQFMKMHLAEPFYDGLPDQTKVLNQRGLNRAKTIREQIKIAQIEEQNLSDLGKKLFGFEVW